MLLDAPTPAARDGARRGLEAIGGKVVHAFDDLLVAAVPAGSEFRAYRIAGVREVVLNAIAEPARGGRLSRGAIAWNAIVRRGEGGGSDELPPDLGAPESDALLPPAVDPAAVVAASRLSGLPAPRAGRKLDEATVDRASLRAPYGATALNTSEYLAGTVSVNVVLPESDGTLDANAESWTADRESGVVAKVAEGLEWLRQQEPQAELSFTYHVIAGRTDARARTKYEPIRRAADPNGTTGEDLWVKEILGKLGYPSGDRWVRSRAFDADTRALDGTDWAVTVFVVDSLNDTDGTFNDGRFAYTWVGGPHVVMTYDNQGWGIDRMDRVIRHELLHAFYAFDEYASSGCVCSDHRGYLDGSGSNCAACNAAATSCVMITNGPSMCAGTRRQIGWADLDGDGVIDVVGEDPDTFLDALPATVCGAPSVTGLAAVVAPTNRNPATITPRSSISIAAIAGVDVRADGSPWTPASPDAATFSAPQERFHASLPPLAPGAHRIEARAVDDWGNRDGSPAGIDVVVKPTASPVGDTLRAVAGSGGSAQLGWAACAGATRYRVLRAGTPSGTFTQATETTATSWTDTASGDGYYLVRAVDACGVVAAE